jgi:hypothetical protein
VLGETRPYREIGNRKKIQPNTQQKINFSKELPKYPATTIKGRCISQLHDFLIGLYQSHRACADVVRPVRGNVEYKI